MTDKTITDWLYSSTHNDYTIIRKFIRRINDDKQQLIMAAKDENDEIRMKTLRLMAHTNLCLDIVVEHLLHDPSVRVRITCMASIYHFPKEMTEPFVIQALSDKSWQVALLACGTVCKNKYVGAIQSLRITMYRSEWKLAWEACVTLVVFKIVDKPVIDRILELAARREAKDHDKFELESRSNDHQKPSRYLKPILMTTTELVQYVETKMKANGYKTKNNKPIPDNGR